MEISPEMQAQIDEQKKQCVYCKIVKGEIPGKTIYQDDVTQLIIDIYPAKKGHSVFIFKEHYPIMPYIPPNEFIHYFGLIPKVCQAIQDGMVALGVNIFLANGGAAGQSFPHVLAHFFPRDEGDKFNNFLWKTNTALAEDKVKMLANNLPIMMSNHFKRNPNQWHVGKGDIPAYLTEIYENNSVIYEDEKVLCIVPEKGVVSGHMEIYSKLEKSEIKKLSHEDSAHLFFTASFAATALFEGLGAHGTNIILKSGVSDDNPEGNLCVHVLPRTQGDELASMHWQPQQPEYDIDTIFAKIKDQAWKIQPPKEEKMVEKVVLPEPKKLSFGKSESVNNIEPNSALDEIQKAIESLHR
tara:strand:- start:95830 stop:96891 length:1062 start_codon:yes stop_codon:yes gene_type:complete